MPVFRVLFALCLVASIGLTADVEVQKIDTKTVSGELISIDPANIALKTATGDVTVPGKDVIRVKMGPPASLAGLKYVDVLLNDGSLLHCSQFVLKGKEVELTVLPSLAVKLPLTAITYVLNDAQDAAVQKQWKDCLASKTFLTKRKSNYDMLAVLRQGSFVDLYGNLGDGDEKGETIQFELESGVKAKPKMAGVFGLYFARKALVNPPDTLCTVEDAHHNQLLAAKLLVAGGKCSVTTVGGVALEYPDLKLLHNLDYRKGRLDYLSEMKPSTVEVSAGEERFDTFRKDKNLDDGPLKLYGKNDLAKKPYPKGLVLLARTVLVYDLNGEYQKFEAVLGSDAQVTGDNNVKVVIEGDGAELFSAELKRKDEPRELRLAIKGVRQLKITVSSDEVLENGNHAVLADAKVSK